MFRVDKRVEYALIALKHLLEAGPGALVTARAISESHQAPFDAVSRALQIMANQGWIKSERGVRGGYHLQASLENLSLLDLIHAVIGPLEIAKCMNEQSSRCSRVDSCNIISPIARLNEKLIMWYRTVRVVDLLKTPPHQQEAFIKVAALTEADTQAT